jgi:hypothetical protein
VKIARRMRTEGGIEALVLAGTELALLRGVDIPSIAFLPIHNVTRVEMLRSERGALGEFFGGGFSYPTHKDAKHRPNFVGRRILLACLSLRHGLIAQHAFQHPD